MHVDALTLAALADELRAELLGARVQDVIQPTPQAVALDCWGGGRSTWLLASAHPRLARLHALDRKPQKLTSEPPTFVMLLRKHLDGARVVAIQQPRWERVLELGFARGSGSGTGNDGDGAERSDPGARAPVVWLVVEIMGRLSNLILRDDQGMILGALRLVGAAVNRYRTIAPNEPYRPPPPQVRTLAGATVPRLDGAKVTADELHAAMLEQLAEPSARKRPARLADLLASTLLGFGQDLSREVAVRAVGDPDAPLLSELPWPAIADVAHALASLPDTAAWQPTLVLAPAVAAGHGADDNADQTTGEPIAFAVYQPRQYGAAILRPMPGVSALLAAFYQRAEWRDAVEGAKGDLRRTLAAQRDRCLRKAEILARDLASLAEADQLRTEGETLLAFQTEVPAGARTVTLDNPFVVIPAAGPAPTLTIALDPRLSAVENANRRFARYHKLRRAAAAIPPQQAANALELARVEQLLTDLALADTTTEITHVRAEVVEAGYLRGRRAGLDGRGGVGSKGGKGKPGKAQSGKGGKANKAGKAGKAGKGGGKGAPLGGAPLRRQSADGFTLLIGKNSRQNEEVTFHLASGSDLWLHARGVPGAHVIVKSGGRPVPESTLRAAAVLAGYYSQSRAAGSVPVDYTEQRYVRHMKGGGPGMVIYERERTLHVAPEDKVDT